VLPDPLALRSAASVLAVAADDAGGQCTALAGVLRTVRWSAPLADEVRRQLAQAEAGGLTGSLALTAGAAHLRAVAVAVDDLRRASARLRTAAESDLQAELAAAPPGPAATAARQALVALPDADDPVWAARADVPAVPLPLPAVVQPVSVPPSPAGLVAADLDGVRRLAESAGVTAEAAWALCDRTAARTTGLGLPALDRYGLAGSRSAAWLAGLTSPLAAAATGWAQAGRTARLLADLLATADSTHELLSDPRLPLALEALAALRAGPDALRDVLDAVAPADRAWLVDVVPGLAGPPAPAPAPAGPRPGPLDFLDWFNGLWQAPADAAALLRQDVARLARAARALRTTARRLPEALGDVFRRLSRAALDNARRARDSARLLEELTAWLRLPDWLRRATTTPVLDVPVLRHVSRLGGAGTVLGVLLDLRDGVSFPLALAKGVAALAAGAAAGAAAAAGVGVVVGAGPVLAGVLVVLAASAAAGFVASWLVGRYGPALGREALAAGRAFGRAASTAARRTADMASGLRGRAMHGLSRAGDAAARWGRRAAGGLGRAVDELPTWRRGAAEALSRGGRTVAGFGRSGPTARSWSGSAVAGLGRSRPAGPSPAGKAPGRFGEHEVGRLSRAAGATQPARGAAASGRAGRTAVTTVTRVAV